MDSDVQFLPWHSDYNTSNTGLPLSLLSNPVNNLGSLIPSRKDFWRVLNKSLILATSVLTSLKLRENHVSKQNKSCSSIVCKGFTTSAALNTNILLKDKCWHFGKFLNLQGIPAELAQVKNKLKILKIISKIKKIKLAILHDIFFPH